MVKTKENEKRNIDSENEKTAKTAKTRCSFCGSEMECPVSMSEADKHVCEVCSELLAEGVGEKNLKKESLFIRQSGLQEHFKKAGKRTDLIADLYFGNYWQNEKNFLKTLSKKDLAEMAFCEGLYTILMLVPPDLQDIIFSLAKAAKGDKKEILKIKKFAEKEFEKEKKTGYIS